ncbi:hypothetical protein GUITHDRAFT_146260 [Guillardia theta CCMP2712]|uniref:3'-5' exonuclease domain-containing protein n=1 Tax=Guillardia theta (strain CCMP2712) TaxID=905079 RepID=L1IIA1_GUITC|nr:hypothetical protein GUITHDRAFT_146260 [Guillardia theta CCMP2712]EKX35802.1 hypothetical protein GUITHDRAFT_146260 [Guillardia theta CCMP2712]|eukprot:XP_005822782.1 hypothetical protein GUITHDRAFT_146260 [Guillardia theta CCMP2712]
MGWSWLLAVLVRGWWSRDVTPKESQGGEYLTLLGDKRVLVKVSRTCESIEADVSLLLSKFPTVVGLDAEWCSGEAADRRLLTARRTGAKRAEIYECLYCRSSAPCRLHRLGQLLSELRSNSLTVLLPQDAERLEKTLGVKTSLYNVDAFGLKSLAKHFSIDLRKDRRITTSDWQAETLGEEQVLYAAEDALVSVFLYMDPQGRQLSNIKIDRILWYINHELADVVHSPGCAEEGRGKAGQTTQHQQDSDPDGGRRNRQRKNIVDLNELSCSCMEGRQFAIRLRFEPKGRGHEGNEYYLSSKENICVRCGSGQGLHRHSVVPHCYRRHFPEVLKSRSSHDIVLLCTACMQLADMKANELRRELALECSAPLHSSRSEVEMRDKEAVRVRGEIPEERKEELRKIVRTFVREHLQELQPEELDLSDRQQLQDLSSQLSSVEFSPPPPPSGPSHGELVVAAQVDLCAFIRRWRTMFLEWLDPQHLPRGWGVWNPLPGDS